MDKNGNSLSNGFNLKTLDETADLLRVSRRQLDRLRDLNHLPHPVILGSRKFYLMSDLEKMVNESRETSDE